MLGGAGFLPSTVCWRLVWGSPISTFIGSPFHPVLLTLRARCDMWSLLHLLHLAPSLPGAENVPSRFLLKPPASKCLKIYQIFHRTWVNLSSEFTHFWISKVFPGAKIEDKRLGSQWRHQCCRKRRCERCYITFGTVHGVVPYESHHWDSMFIQACISRCTSEILQEDVRTRLPRPKSWRFGPLDYLFSEGHFVQPKMS